MGEARVIAKARKAKTAATAQTFDSFQNFLSHTGKGTGNLNDGAHYAFNPISRNRLELEWAYRGSWVCGIAVDCVAEDMTREGVEIESDDSPDKLAELAKEADRLQIWSKLCETLKWSRLYGGALAFMMIDGQDPQTPLRLDRLQKGQFKGLLPMDRWLVTPSLQDLVKDMGPHFGKPKFYQTVPDTAGMPLMNIHYSRLIRIEGVELPYWQRIAENLWGQSVLERLFDRLIAFDSTTAGMAQLVYKAHLRTYAVDGLRDIIAAGGPAMKGLLAQINMIRAFQSNEGITLMDAKDKFETHQYAFSGLGEVTEKFEDQLCGALQIPKVRLFGQSPGGLNSAGDSELTHYYDSIKQQQVQKLGPGIEILYRVLYLSTFGKEPAKSFTIDFKPLWQMSDEQRANVTNAVTAAIVSTYENQIIDRATAMKELRQLSDVVHVFSNISDKAITDAESDPAPSPQMLGLVPPVAPDPGSQEEGGPAKPNENGKGGKALQ